MLFGRINIEMEGCNQEKIWGQFQAVSRLASKWKLEAESFRQLSLHVDDSIRCRRVAEALDRCSDDLLFVFGIIETFDQGEIASLD